MLPVLRPLRGKGPSAFEITPGPLDTPCWIWQGCLNSKGYPVRGTKDGRFLVHRVVCAETQGPLADGDQVHHRCERRACVNPQHLAAHTPLQHAREHRGNQTAAQRLADTLPAGPLGARQLAEQLDLNPTTVRIALLRAGRRGELVQLVDGRWALPTTERKAA